MIEGVCNSQIPPFVLESQWIKSFLTMVLGGEILVAAPERWDEACYAVPAVRAMVASGMDVGVLCEDAQARFWETIHGLKVVSFFKKSKVKFAADSIKGQWAASLAWAASQPADVFKLAGIPRRLGPSDPLLKKCLTHPMKFATSPLDHRVRTYLSAMEELGVETSRPEFFSPVDLGTTRIGGAVLLAPGSDFGPSHEWELDRWVEIARRLGDTGRRVVIATVEDDRRLGELLAKQVEGAELLEISPSVEALPVLSAYEVFISADGCLPHLAAHVGATCVTLFGPNDPAWKRPLGRRHAVVKRHVECAPCLLAHCPLDRRCQNELEIERVWGAVAAKIA
jgi:ADP-heptose:LPS heptosyltransferase